MHPPEVKAGSHEVIASYTPRIVAGVTGPPTTLPHRERFFGAVLQTDITGFTGLTEQMASSGTEGAEKITRLLNRCFGRLVEVVVEGGGDVVKFAGDAFMATWPTAAMGSARDAVLAACKVGLGMQEAVEQMGREGDLRLQLRVGISVGDLMALHLGGVSERRELLLLGGAIAEVTRAEQLARPGNVVVAPAAAAAAESALRTRPVQDGYQRLFALRSPPPALPLPSLLPTDSKALLAYIPRSVRHRLNHGETRWLAELRPLSVLFVSLPEIDHRAAPARVQALVRRVQQTLQRFEGQLNKLTHDDKGTTAVAAMGLPPLAHEDDATRACEAALEICAAVAAMDSTCTIGIASGTAFCGEVGSPMRREYTMIGDVVNVAARLMQHADQGVLVDAQTQQLAAGRVAFQPGPPAVLKGRTAAVPVFVPLARTAQRLSGGTVVGRSAERMAIEALIGRQQAGGSEGGRLLLQGSAGMGKSALVAHALARAESLGVEVLTVVADSIERQTPYFAWRPALWRALGVDDEAPPEGRLAQVRATLDTDANLARRGPLLGDLLPVRLDDNTLTRQLEGAPRADNVRALVVDLLARRVTDHPCLLVVEDAHWLDSLSIALLGAVARALPSLGILLSSRPPPELAPASEKALEELDGIEQIELNKLDGADLLTMVSHRLGVDSLPPAAMDLIRERAGGNPLYSLELSSHLVELGVLDVNRDTGEVKIDRAALRELSLPDTLQGLLTSRFDRLAGGPQLTLKVASVIGRGFRFPTLAAVHPNAPGTDELRGHLEALSDAGLCRPEPGDVETWRFHHALTREAAYNLLVFERRRELHRRVARWTEEAHAESLATHYPVLAEHYRRAEVYDAAVRYLGLAGIQARDRFANHEARRALSDALELAHTESVEVASTTTSAWLRALGEVAQRLDEVPAAVEHHRHALKVTGGAAPAHSLSIAVSLVGQLALAGLRLVLRPGAHRPEKAAAAAFASDLHQRLAELAYMRHRPLELLHATLRSHNLAERAGPCPELARSAATMGIVMGLLPALPGLPTPGRRLAERYFRQAHAVAQSHADDATAGYVAIVDGAWRAGVGDWEVLRELSGESARIFDELGDHHRWEQGYAQHALASLYRGHHEEAATNLGLLLERATLRGAPIAECWARAGLAEMALDQNRPDEAGDLEALEGCLERGVTSTECVIAQGLLAAAHLAQGDTVAARAAVEAATALLQAHQPTSYYTYPGVVWTVETWISIAASGDTAALGRAREALAILVAFARVFPIARPRAAYLEGRLARLEGQTARAEEAMLRAIREAELLEMPGEEARALRALGRDAEADALMSPKPVSGVA